MAIEKPIEVITPPNMLKVRVGGPIAMLDSEAVRRAEEALKELSSNFESWLEEEVQRLEAAYAILAKSTDKPFALGGVFERSHDLKGLGTTYEYPLITRLAGSLCKMLESENHRKHAPLSLVDAHVNAIRAIVRDAIKTDTHPIGKALSDKLDRQVALFCKTLETSAGS